MKIYHVYELYNLLGTVEYVGETSNPYQRWYSHKTNSKSSGSGKFYGRADIQMHLVREFDNHKDAYEYQCELQKEYGLGTDSERYSKASKDKTKHFAGIKQTPAHIQKRSEALKLHWANKKSNSIL